jgi:hypothetical protein
VLAGDAGVRLPLARRVSCPQAVDGARHWRGAPCHGVPWTMPCGEAREVLLARRLDGGLGAHAATAPPGTRVGGAPRGVGRAPMPGCQGKGRAQTAGPPVLRAASGQPVPGDEPFAPPDARCPVRRHGLQDRCGGRVHGPVPSDLALLGKDAAGPGPRGQGEATGTRVVCGEPRLGSPPLRAVVDPAPAVPRWDAEEGASIRINTLQRTGGQRRFGTQWFRRTSGVVSPPPLNPWR